MPAVLNLFDQILHKGFEPDVFVIGLAEHLRNMLVCKDEATLSLLEVGDNLRERYRKQSTMAPAAFLLTALSLCNDCDINYKMARHKRLHVEMALIKMCHIGQAVKAIQHGASAPPLEKKTPDRSIGAPAGEQPGAGNAVPVALPAAKPPSDALELSPDQMSSLATEVRLGLRKTEKISLRLEDFEEAVAVEEAENATRESRFTLDNAKASWSEYTALVESPTLRQALTSAKLSLNDKTLVATVGLSVHRGLLLEENTRLLDYLRSQLHDPSVKLSIELDEVRAAEIQAQNEVKKPLTTKEKFEKMREINPLVTDLLQRFDLKLED
jgi:DNA polymerase III subunit gamma/tau